MGEWTPIYISMVLLIFIGVILPMTISPFVDGDGVNSDSFIYPITNIVKNGFDVNLFWVFDTTIDPFSWFGDGFKDVIYDYLSVFSHIPSVLSVPLLIFIILGFVYGFTKLLRG